MAAATAAAKKTTAKKDEAPAPEKPKRTVQRTTQKLTPSQAKVLEAQFDTRLKDVTGLDEKLAEIEVKWPEEERAERFVPKQVASSREKLAQALVLIGEAKADFAEIGEQFRTFLS